MRLTRVKCMNEGAIRSVQSGSCEVDPSIFSCDLRGLFFGANALAPSIEKVERPQHRLGRRGRAPTTADIPSRIRPILNAFTPTQIRHAAEGMRGMGWFLDALPIDSLSFRARFRGRFALPSCPSNRLLGPSPKHKKTPAHSCQGFDPFGTHKCS